MTQLLGKTDPGRAIASSIELPPPLGGAYIGVTSRIIHHPYYIELQPIGSHRGASAKPPPHSLGEVLTPCLDSSEIPRLLAPAKVPNTKKGCYKANYIHL